MTMARLNLATAAAVFLMSSFAVAPAQSAQSDVDFLTAYIGSWAGESVLVGGERPEPFRCRLTVSKGSTVAKINYSGRCTVVRMNISVSGTILYDTKGNRYQAAMNSNAGFKGQAVGRESGGHVYFDLQERQVDRGGNDMNLGASLDLVDGTIVVDFQVEFNDSGQVLTAKVPFKRAK